MKTLIVCLFITLALAFTAAAGDVTGKWSGSYTAESGDSGTAYVIIQQNGTTITGSGGPDANEQWPGLEGTVKGNKVTVQVTSASDGTVYKCDLMLDGDHLKGDVLFTPPGGQPGKAKLDLTRVKQ
jgi:hypothetical protein